MSAENDEFDVSHQAGASDSQPGNISQPEITHPAEAGRSTSQPGENLAQTLSEINVNMGTMASLLKTIVERQNTEPQKKRRHSQHESLSADFESEDIEYETASKRRREDDELSLSPSDGDIADLLEGSNSKEVEAPSKTTEPEEELELLKSLEADFTDDENVGAKINQSLANIASKRWGITLPNDKLKALLAKHAKPENCADISTVRVNPLEIWDQMNNFKRKADLRVSNIQQALQKATFGILKASVRLLHKKGHISASYIDDLYLQGRTYDLCFSNVFDTFIQFDTLGFTIHPEKSVFIPSQRLVLLGFIIDSVAMTITLTPEKALKVEEACATLLGQGPTTIRQVACVIGKIISSFPGVMHGHL